MPLCSSKQLTVSAPARLHLGLYRLGHGQTRFGGLGVMIQPPHVQIVLSPAERFEVVAPSSERERVQRFALAWQQFYATDLPACRLELKQALPPHSGLGSGSQLALSIAAALSVWLERPVDEPQVLARAVQRGNRSAVGSYGFSQGGFIAERGWTDDVSFPPLDARMDVSSEWRFVLLIPNQDIALSGAEEEKCMANLPAPAERDVRRLIQLAGEEILPALAARDFHRFSESIYQYNALAGLHYASIQGGPYNGPRVTGLVELCRRLGVQGVGQSSWGPTVFALLPSQEQADQFVAQVHMSDPQASDLQIIVAAAANQGAQIQFQAKSE